MQNRVQRGAPWPLILFATLSCRGSVDVAQPPAPRTAERPDEDQIQWQRSLADALAIARAEARPLFVAVNMDGESASERIVRENYRNRSFVASTRHCVCLVASVFRHNARDHDAAGRRIPCPRLGVVTCGEHIELEPILHDELLHGDRVAPRHALLRPDGTKLWDHSLIFDLRDLDALLARSAAEYARHRDAAKDVETPGVPDSRALWRRLAAARHAAGRARFEDALAAIEDPATLTVVLDAVRTAGDAGSLDALRIAVQRLVVMEEQTGALQAARDRLVAAARGRELAPALAAAVRERLVAVGRDPTDLGRTGAETLLPLLAWLDGGSATTRSTILTFCATGSSPHGLERAFGAGPAASIAQAVATHGGSVSCSDLLRIAEWVQSTEPPGSLPRPSRITDDLPEATVLEEQLHDLDDRIRNAPGDAELLGTFAKATLDLARRRLESGSRQAALLLEDAAQAFAEAVAQKPGRYEWWIESARTAYFREEFAEQVRFGRRALRVALGAGARQGLPKEAEILGALAQGRPPGDVDVLSDSRAIEALRWIGDGNARLLAARAGKDPAVEIAGMLDAVRALGIVAASPFSDGKDWLSLASLLETLGLDREAIAALVAAAVRNPAASDLRKAVNDGLWRCGRIDVAPAVAASIARRHPDSADAAWFVGYAYLLAGEDHRRREAPDLAIADYASGEAAFARAMELQPDYAQSCSYHIASSWFGRGMAHLLADRRAPAADCLVRAVQAAPQIATSRDGLDREPVDLVDQCLEWRASGPSPVDPIELLDELEAQNPGNPFWAIAISDAELREALRADGRNPERAERETVDAGGKPIRMRMGLPTPAGDSYLRASIAAARRALRHGDTPENRRPLAQSATIWAERMLQRLDGPGTARAREVWLEEARRGLAEAAPLLDLEPPAPASGRDALAELARALRAKLGPARPRLRAGR